MKQINAKTRREAKKKAPDAIVFVKNNWGFLAFNSQDEYTTWKKQK